MTAPLSIIHIDIDPVIHLGGLSIHWYGVMYAVAFLAGYRFALVPYLVPRGIDRATIERMLTWTIVTGLIGARLYYDVQNLDRMHNPVDVIAVWNGGMAFFGAILTGIPTAAFLAWRQRLPVWTVMDAAVLFAVVGQPIGRIGNIINGDVLGSQSNLPWATQYDNANAILQPGFVNCHDLVAAHQPCVDALTGAPYAYQPAAAYEALATILIGLLLLSLIRRHVADGVLCIAYVALYSISQFVVFFWRASEPTVALGLKQAQWTGIGMLVLGVPLLYLVRRRFPPRGPEDTVPEREPEPTAEAMA